MTAATIMVDVVHELSRAQEIAIERGSTQILQLDGVEVKVNARSNLDKLERQFYRSFYRSFNTGIKEPVGPCAGAPPSEYDPTLVSRLVGAAQAAPNKGLDPIWVSLLENAAERIIWLESQAPFSTPE